MRNVENAPKEVKCEVPWHPHRPHLSIPRDRAALAFNSTFICIQSNHSLVAVIREFPLINMSWSIKDMPSRTFPIITLQRDDIYIRRGAAQIMHKSCSTAHTHTHSFLHFSANTHIRTRNTRAQTKYFRIRPGKAETCHFALCTRGRCGGALDCQGSIPKLPPGTPKDVAHSRVSLYLKKIIIYKRNNNMIRFSMVTTRIKYIW